MFHQRTKTIALVSSLGMSKSAISVVAGVANSAVSVYVQQGALATGPEKRIEQAILDISDLIAKSAPVPLDLKNGAALRDAIAMMRRSEVFVVQIGDKVFNYVEAGSGKVMVTQSFLHGERMCYALAEAVSEDLQKLGYQNRIVVSPFGGLDGVEQPSGDPRTMRSYRRIMAIPEPELNFPSNFPKK